MIQIIDNTAKLLKSPILGFRGRYIAPHVETIHLDNDISLALESAPPVGPGESYNKMSGPEHFTNNPIETNNA